LIKRALLDLSKLNSDRQKVGPHVSF